MREVDKVLETGRQKSVRVSVTQQLKGVEECVLLLLVLLILSPLMMEGFSCKIKYPQFEKRPHGQKL